MNSDYPQRYNNLSDITIKTESARNGKKIILINENYIHSKYNPENEGEKIAQKAISEKKNNAIRIFGLGFGYHILPLLKEYDQITVFEPLNDVLNLAEKQAFLDELFAKTEVITDFDKVPRNENQDVMVLPSYRNMFAELISAFRQNCSEEQVKSVTGKLHDYSGLRVIIDYPVYGGSYTTAKYIQHACEELGLHVKIVDNAHAETMLHAITAVDNKSHSSYMALKLTELLSDLFWEEFKSFKPHLALFPAQSPATKHLLNSIRESSDCTSVFWFVEDYKRFDYWKEYAGSFDFFYGIQKEPFLSMLKSHGAVYADYLPMAASSELHKVMDLSEEDKTFYGSDVAFMGAGYPNRHTLFAQLTEFDLKIWGTGWENNRQLEPFVQKNGERVSIDESVKIYNSAKININLHSAMNADFFEKDGDFVNPRTFEIIACGGFQLVDERSLLPEILEPGIDVVTFSSIFDLKEKIRYYLANPGERQTIVDNGSRKVKEHHLYKHRIEQIINNAYQKSEKFRNFYAGEKDRHDQLMKSIEDEKFIHYLNTLTPEKRNSFHAIIEDIRANQSNFEDYEVIMLILDTFYTNSG